jgi:alanine racemase
MLKGAQEHLVSKLLDKYCSRRRIKPFWKSTLGAIVHNLNLIRSLLKPETKLMAMVKASGYGSGSFEIARVLQFHRVHYLAVAYADEGIELRKAGITLPIMVMSPEEHTFDAMIQL